MNLGPLLITLVVVPVAVASMVWLKRRTLEFQAQVIATLFAVYILILLSMWATGADLLVESGHTERPLKTVLFAFAAGWLAQLMLGLDKLTADPKKTLGVSSTAFLRPLLGGLAGLAGAVLGSDGHFDSLGDEAAMGYGLFAGAAGILILDVRNRFLLGVV